MKTKENCIMKMQCRTQWQTYIVINPKVNETRMRNANKNDLQPKICFQLKRRTEFFSLVLIFVSSSIHFKDVQKKFSSFQISHVYLLVRQRKSCVRSHMNYIAPTAVRLIDETQFKNSQFIIIFVWDRWMSCEPSMNVWHSFN